MAKTTQEVEIKLTIEGADGSKADVEKVRAEFEAFGDTGAKAAQKIVGSMEANDAAYKKLINAMESGSPRQERVWAQLRLLTENYKKSVIDTFGSIEKAPPAAAAAIEKFESRLQAATVTVRKNKDALQEMKTELGEGGEKWGGLGEAVNKALGPLGSVQAKIGLVAAAFAEGWQMGQRLNTLFGTDMSEWDETSTRFGAKLGAIIKAIADDVVALGNVALAFSTGSIGDMKRSIGELKDAIVNHMKTSKDAVSLWGNEWDAAHPKVKKAADAVDGHTSATDKNSESLKKNTAALTVATQAEQLFEAAKAETAARMKKLAEETDKLQKAIAKVAEEEAKETKALTAAQAVFDQAEINTINRTSDMQYQGRVVGEVTSELDKQKTEVQALTDKYGANDPMTLQAIQRQQQLQIQLENATQRYDDAKGDVESYTKKQADANREIERAKEKLSELGPELKKQQDALTNLNVPVGNLAAYMAKTAEHAPKAATGIDMVGISSKNAVEPSKALAEAMGKIQSSSRSAVDTLGGEYATSADKAAASFRKLADEVDRAVTGFNALITKSAEVVAAVERVEAATAKAAGSDSGGGDSGASFDNFTGGA